MNRILPALFMLIAALYLSQVIGFSRGVDQMSKVAVSTIKEYTLVGSDMREVVHCEFEPPLKHVTLIHHWYTDREELNVDYLTLAEPNDVDHVWGWSNCLHQPADNAAWCDVYAVIPEYVHADMSMDTLGHEALHGSCGNFHK